MQPIDPEAGPPQSPLLARKREPTGLLHLGIPQRPPSRTTEVVSPERELVVLNLKALREEPPAFVTDVP